MNQDFIDGKPMLRLTFGGAHYVLPWEAGVQVLNLMREAQAVDSYYAPQAYETRWRVGSHGVQAESFSIADQAALKLQGE